MRVIDAKRYIPEYGLPIKVYTTHNQWRDCVLVNTPVGYMFKATDCTHPMQNMNMNGHALGWTYENEGDYFSHPPKDNPFYHWEQGDKILKSIKRKKWWQFWK